MYHSNYIGKLIPAKDIYEAINIAQRLNKDGVFDIFRGQNYCWNLISSMNRDLVSYDDKSNELHFERLNLFDRFIHEFTLL